jgi:ABC-2 type transport system ATP-binding protein
MIRAESLTKRYGRETAIDRLTVAIPRGSVVAVLGPNGAGKTTLLRLLAGIIRPSAGGGHVLGRDMNRQALDIRRAVALVPESKMVYAGVSVADFLAFYASFFTDADMSAAATLAGSWGVAADRRADALSRGGLTKVMLAAVLSRRPELLVLDEPTDGLDAGVAEDLWSRLMERAGGADGAGVVLATHRIDEVERVCDRVVVLGRGRLILEGELDDVRARWRHIVIRPAPGFAVESVPGIVASRTRNGLVEATTSSWDSSYRDRLPDGAELVQEQGMSLREIYLAAVAHES